MTGTHSRGRPRRARPPADNPAVVPAGDLDAAGLAARIPAAPVAFYGRTAHAAGTGDSQAGRRRQLALCRAVIAIYGSQVSVEYFDESCRADCPWHLRQQGQALLAALSGPARTAQALVTADPWRLLPRRPPANGTGILQQLALWRVLLVLADTGVSVLTPWDYALLGSLTSGPAGSVLLSGPVAWPSGPDRRLRGKRPGGRAAAGQPRGGEPG